MFKYLIIYNVLFLPFLRGNSVPISVTPEQKIIKHDLFQDKINQVPPNVITEGGTIIPSNPIIQLKDHPTLLLNSEDELGEYKNKSVVGRKGVNYTHVDDVQNDNTSLNITTLISNITDKLPAEVQPSKSSSDATYNITDITQKVNITKSHKPLILSHEALEKMDEINNLDVSESNIPNIKIHSMKSGGHPAMIMPIVITILVVPMFAVVGYMALKRGQEAWKNRHYKRMDFLLDGMYNE